MRTAWRLCMLAGMVGVAGSLLAQQPSSPAAGHWAIEVHGGAGVIKRSALKPEAEAAYRASLAQAAEAGAKVLDQGGSSLDAVEAAIRILEDDPLFNAGRGAVFTAEGKNELDAAIMDGSNLKAGAVAGVTRTRHPISLARAVMEKSPHAKRVIYNADPIWKFVSWTNPRNPTAENSFDLVSILPDTIKVTVSPGSVATAEGWKLSHSCYIKDHYYFFLSSYWSRAEAEQAAECLRILAKDARECHHQEVDKGIARFRAKSQAWREMEVKPAMPEEARRHKILAENAFREKDMEKAADEYSAALNIYPYWPRGLFNVAKIEAENTDYHLAIMDMRKYLELVPDAQDAQACRDEIVVWQNKMGE